MLLPQKFNEQTSLKLLEDILGKRHAKQIWEWHGSFPDIIRTSDESIKRVVPTITDKKITQLRACFKLAEQLYLEKRQNPVEIETAEDIANIARPFLRFKNIEEAYVVCMSEFGELLGIDKIAEGNRNSVYFTPKQVFAPAIRNNADQIALIHNHPGGSLTPSKEDIEHIEELQSLCRAMDIFLFDDLIMSPDCHGVGDDFISMRRLGYVNQNLLKVIEPNDAPNNSP